MIHILTDSCADLNQELINRFHIGVIPLSVYINDKNYHDGKDIFSDALYLEVQKGGQLPKTAAPSVAEFVEFFNQYPGDILFISIGSKLSATNQNALLALEFLPERKIQIIDSSNLSTGIGLLVLAAAEKRDTGASFDDIYAYVLSLIPNVDTSFVIDTLDYLYKGGRCTALESIMGSLLSIHPIIEVRKDGTLGVRKKVRGAGHKAIDALLETFKNNLEKVDLHRVFITHSGGDIDPEYLLNQMKSIANIDEIHITSAGATIASHCGPKTIGILYLTKE